MTLDDLSEVWHLGEKIFAPSYLPFTYQPDYDSGRMNISTKLNNTST
jgi:hypothetical protein